jgi:hypothetical protein
MSEFIWKEQLVLQFIGKLATPYNQIEVMQRMVDFKASKQPKPEWVVLDWKSNDGVYIDKWDGKSVINAVKRFSDGEVFTVGDVIIDPNKGNRSEITSLHAADTFLVYSGETGWKLKDVHKAEQQVIKQVVFLTPSEIEKLHTLLNTTP